MNRSPTTRRPLSHWAIRWMYRAPPNDWLSQPVTRMLQLRPPPQWQTPSEGAMATPAREQYLALKAQHPDALLWFRMGDFYELFDDDAQVAARELRLTLTSREFGRGERVPMAGVPHHAADSYLARLVRKGYRV